MKKLFLFLFVTSIVIGISNVHTMQPKTKRHSSEKNKITILSECLTDIQKLDKKNLTEYKKEVLARLATIKNELGNSCHNKKIHQECLKLKIRIALTIFSYEDKEQTLACLKKHLGHSQLLKFLLTEAVEDIPHQIERTIHEDDIKCVLFFFVSCMLLYPVSLDIFKTLFGPGYLTTICLLSTGILPILSMTLFNRTYAFYHHKSFIAAVLDALNITVDNVMYLKKLSLLEIPDNPKCIICHETKNESTNPWVLTICNHRFHESCLESWLAINPVCPLCKITIYGETH